MASTPKSPSVLAIPGPFSHELVHTRGTRLHAAVAGDPRAPLVLFLHDALGGWFDFRFLFEPLSPDFHVAAMSARGFAQSDKPPMGYSLRHGVGDISGMIRTLGHGRATIVAAGTSARLATALAANYPERVRSLYLVDAISRPNTTRVALAYAAPKFPELVAKRSLPDADPETLKLRALSYQIGGTAGPRTRHAKLPLRPLPVKWSTTIDAPVTYVTGTRYPDLATYLTTHS
ncbi:alpha/beta fold hydrolase [Corynebacterium sp. H130]|uniref:alpha/beta fold hydrolase n=1 Tax=Corynebacterium sp. H130 TaxID=3133444 RepID=UPI0030AAE9FA